MDVNTICGARGVTIREIPQGTTMPESAEPTGQDIEALGEMIWALESLNEYFAVRTPIMVRLGQAGQSGGITDHAWQIWGQVSQQLSASTAVTVSALPLENLISGVITALEAEQSVNNVGDLDILRGILGDYESFLTGFQTALTDGNHPIAAGITYDSSKSFKHNIRSIVNQIYGRISSGVQRELGYNDQTFWTDTSLTADSARILLDSVQAQTQELCSDYNAAVPAPPIIQPPVTPAAAPRLLGYGINIVPLNAFQVVGDSSSPIQSGPGIQGDAALALHLSDEISLQLSYLGRLGMNSFSPWTSDLSYDSGAFSFTYDNFTAQASYFMQQNFNADYQEHLGALVVGYRFFNGLLEPFGGGIAGANDESAVYGGLVGVRSRHEFEGSNIALSGLIHYSLINREELNHQVGATIDAAWSPGSFGNADFEVGAYVSALYNSTPSGANVTPGLVLRWRGGVIPMYPVVLH
ncbi:MAG: hypothetical protein KJ732_04045 [Candidatus Margulisbacteria bacterium]|nr:hypothetical protein [Candidatus Margulisiibacteriota bacterium]